MAEAGKRCFELAADLGKPLVALSQRFVGGARENGKVGREPSLDGSR